MYKYQHIIKNGEVSCDTMITVLDKMGYVNDLDVKVSNGMSFIFVSGERKNVYQYFTHASMAKRIFDIMNILWKNKNIKIDFYFSNIRYNLYDYIAQFVSYIPDNIIVWKKHLCLNSFGRDKIVKIINDNYFKLIWDISKCLYGLHVNNILHGDARIDNIGILNDKFILFDFDGSKVVTEPNFTFLKDISDFVESIKFNSGDNWSKINKNIPKADMSYFFISKIISNYTNRFKIKLSSSQIIYELDNLKIKL